MKRIAKRYDRAYFDTWYRSADAALVDRAELRRKVAMLVALTEYYLERPIENVLDVGCGEANWRAPLLRLRPGVHYIGLDTSVYAVQRFGRSRNIHLMSFEQLAEQRFEQPFDLIICANVLHYLGAAEIRRGLSGFGDLLGGAAFLEVYARGDKVEGDRAAFTVRNAAWYRKAFAEAGLQGCGSHVWLSAELAGGLSALGRCD